MGDEEVDAQFAAVFARMLAANFAREVRSKDGSDDERAADKPQDPPADNRAPPPTTAAGEQAKGAAGTEAADASLTAPVNTRKGPRLASSRFRGCTRHRRTKRFEAHIWDQRQQRYLGGFDREIDAGRAHDVMAIKCRGLNDSPQLNFPMESYAELLPLIDRLPKEEVVAQLRQLNRSAPRPKSKKPVLKARSSSNLAGLTTRSGRVNKEVKGGSAGRQILPEEAMASFCRANGLAPLKLTAGSLSKANAGLSLPPRRGVASAFASQKDLPLPQWDPALPESMSPDYSGRMTQLRHSRDSLLHDSHAALLAMPTLNASMQLYRSPTRTLSSYNSSGQLFLGRAISEPQPQPASRELHSPHGMSALQDSPLLTSPESMQFHTGSGKLMYEVGELLTGAKYAKPLPSESSFEACGSILQSLDSEGSNLGSLAGRMQQQDHSHPYGFAATGKAHGHGWEADPAKAGGQRLWQPSLQQPWGVEAQQPPAFGVQQPPLALNTKTGLPPLEHQNSSASIQTEGQGHLKAAEGGASPSDLDGSLSFTQLLTHELPPTDALEASVLDVMGSWSP